MDEDGFPRLDKYGHQIFEQVPVVTMDGKPAQVMCWTEPPTIAALCLKLRIHKATFARYEDDEELGEVVAYARARIEAYYAGRVDHKDGVRGAAYMLDRAFGWSDNAQDTGPQEIRVSFGNQIGGDAFG